ncbi:hypothetical protein ACHAXR_011632 [Thalassiosira sp. AJA248-18]
MMSSSTVVVLFYRYFLPTATPSSLPPTKSATEQPASSSPSSAATIASGAAIVVDEATLQFFQINASHYLPLLQKYQYNICHTLGNNVKGRLLISQEGINGTLSFPTMHELKQYVNQMEAFDLLHDLGVPPTTLNTGGTAGNGEEARDNTIPNAGGGRLFANIDWKTSTVENNNCWGEEEGNNREPFPDLKIQVVKEIVNTGGTVHLDDIPKHTGKEICPKDFHQILLDAQQNNDNGKERRSCRDSTGEKKAATNNQKKEVVLIDVRNTFEHSIGHFLHPHSSTIMQDGSSTHTAAEAQNASSHNTEGHNEAYNNKTPKPALNPNTVTFSHFDSTFCSQYSESLKDKKVLMYCTGGIRCVKASAMLKQRGVEDVMHLKGGIHRYVEQYGSNGFYKGKVFVFDQRVALDPDSIVSQNKDVDGSSTKEDEHGKEKAGDKVVGKCIECQIPYDQISGATLCTVCRDLILLCSSCKSSLSEFHCERHQLWKNVYFTFLEKFTLEELQTQYEELMKLHNTTYVPPKEHKNVRRTLRKQMDKVGTRIKDLKEGKATVDKNAKRRCRTCFDSEEVCDGLCWGFWRSLQSPHQTSNGDGKLESILAVQVGDRVTPGPNWNVLRHGNCCNLAPESQPRKRSRRADDDAGQQSQSTPLNGESKKLGTVLEVKSWASGGNEMDCVVVSWDADSDQSATQYGRHKRKGHGNKNNNQKSSIYRWGAVARNGKRMYDVKLVS